MTDPALATALHNICTALELTIDSQQTDRLLGYLALLRRWSAAYNLTAIRDPAAMLTQHLGDCLAVVRPLVHQRGVGDVRLLDVGSGAGLPGIVIATMLPRVDVTCVDSVGKKAAFVRQAAGELRLQNLHAEHSRVEQLEEAPYDVIVSRAFASLEDFVRLTANRLASEGCWMAMKGKFPRDEIARLPATVSVFHVEQLDVPGLHAERCLIWLKAACPRSTAGL